jgi:hypothetical protein
MSVEIRGGSFRVHFPDPETGWSPAGQVSFTSEQAARSFDALWKLRREQGRLGDLYGELYPDEQDELKRGLRLGDYLLDEFWPHYVRTPGRGRSTPKAAKTTDELKRALNRHVFELNGNGPDVWGEDALAHLPLAEIDAATAIAAAQRWEDAGIGAEVERKLLGFLSAAYDHAVVVHPELYGSANPFSYVPRPSQSSTSSVRALWPETVERLRADFLLLAELSRARHDGRLSRAQAKKLHKLAWPVPETPYPAEFGASFVSAFAYSSARPQELLAVPEDAVEGKRLRVNVHNEDGEILPGTKSTAYPSKRALLIGPGVSDFAAWRERSRELLAENGVHSDRLFPRADGELWSESDYRTWRSRYFRPVALRLAFDVDSPTGPRPNALRHCYASCRVAAGHDLLAIERSMGSSKVASTYAEVKEDWEEADGPLDIDATVAAARAAAPVSSAADFRIAASGAGLDPELVDSLLAAAFPA